MDKETIKQIIESAKRENKQVKITLTSSRYGETIYTIVSLLSLNDESISFVDSTSQTIGVPLDKIERIYTEGEKDG